MGPRVSIVLAVSVLVGSVSCANEASDRAESPAARVRTTLRDDTVTVASFDFAESELLAELYSEALEAGHFDVRREFGLGPREVVFPALAGGLVEFVPEYAGSALQFIDVDQAPAATGAGDANEALAVALRDTGVAVLESSPAEDANTFVVTRETAQRDGLRSLSDVAGPAPTLTFGGPPECESRPYCLAGLEEVYGLSFGEVLTLDAGGPLTLQALERGDVDVALLFTTDPALNNEDLVQLDDDRELQPSENVTPLLRRELVDRFGPQLVARIDAVSEALDTEALRSLNQRVAGGEDVASVARSWLREQGLT
jgi:osmoprotectant transport system substrate-binding protein